jgi:hypothetical protein
LKVPAPTRSKDGIYRITLNVETRLTKNDVIAILYDSDVETYDLPSITELINILKDRIRNSGTIEEVITTKVDDRYLWAMTVIDTYWNNSIWEDSE